MNILQPVLSVVHFLSAACFFILSISYHIGRGIFWVLCQACHLVRDLFAALAIIGEEFYRFLCELDVNISQTLGYIRSTTNCSIGSFIEALAMFGQRLTHFFSNTRVHTRLLATSCGRFVSEFFELLQRALLLIADSAWWLLTIIPRTLMRLLLAIGDGLVFGIGGGARLLVAIVHNIIEDIFRYTIAVVVIFLLLSQRRRLFRLLRITAQKILRFCRLLLQHLITVRMLPWQRTHPPRRTINLSSHVVRRDPLPRYSRSPPPPASLEKLLESQRCVACRDQLKCVLLLPCKHLCLCQECADYMVLSARSRNCPLCRSEIAQSISVYI